MLYRACFLLCVLCALFCFVAFSFAVDSSALEWLSGRLEQMQMETRRTLEKQQAEARAIQIETRVALERLQSGDTENILSPAHLAIKVDKQLRMHPDEYLQHHEPADGSGTPVLSAEQQALVSAVKSEAAMVAQLTPFLWRWLCGGSSVPAFRCLVNSETKKWLEVMPGEDRLNQKPDMWLGPSYVVSELPAPTATQGNTQEQEAAAIRAKVLELASSDCNTTAPVDLSSNPVRYLFGKPAAKRWFDSVFPLSAKLSLTDTALGEEMIYLKHLSNSSHPFSRGMAYDQEKFVLLKCVNKRISWRLEGRWCQRGSGERIREFFSIESEWESAIRQCCTLLQARPVRYLGCGGTARVIEVRLKGQLFALKTVLGPHIEQLALEYIRVRDLIAQRNKDLCHVLPGGVSGYTELPDLSAACFLLSSVGEPLNRTKVMASLQSFRPILTALQTLHIAGERHGDPRLPNLLRLKRKSGRNHAPQLSQHSVGQPSVGSSSSVSATSQTPDVSSPVAPCSSSRNDSLSDDVNSDQSNPSVSTSTMLSDSDSDSSSPRLMWVDFMVSNARTALEPAEQKFDVDLLHFIGYLADRNFSVPGVPSELKDIMHEYHRLLDPRFSANSASNSAALLNNAKAIFTFIRESMCGSPVAAASASESPTRQ